MITVDNRGRTLTGNQSFVRRYKTPLTLNVAGNQEPGTVIVGAGRGEGNATIARGSEGSPKAVTPDMNDINLDAIPIVRSPLAWRRPRRVIKAPNRYQE